MLIEGATWTHGDNFVSYGTQHNFITLKGDTLLDGKVYSTFVKKHFKGWEPDYEPTEHLNSFLREEHGIVYLYTGNGDDAILYNFNLTINDTFVEPIYPTNRTLVVTDTTTFYDWDNIPRKYLFLEDISNSDYPKHEAWIEGIGSLNSFLDRPFVGNDDLEHKDSIYCYYINEELKFSFTDWHICGAIPTATNDIELSVEVTLFPNPAQENITIFFAEQFTGSYELTDLTGRLLHEGAIANQKQLTLDVSTYEDGLYLITVADDLSRTRTLKFVVGR